MRRSGHGLDTARPSDQAWELQGACRQYDPDLWFPDRDDMHQSGGDVYAKPRAICRSCPVWELCRQHALDRPERYGMWGGLSPLQRRALTRHGAVA